MRYAEYEVCGMGMLGTGIWNARITALITS